LISRLLRGSRSSSWIWTNSRSIVGPNVASSMPPYWPVRCAVTLNSMIDGHTVSMYLFSAVDQVGTTWTGRIRMSSLRLLQ